jgi:signal transduction histidine kinase
MSEALQERITGEVSEIYQNAFEHSQSEIGVFSCGQHYPKAGWLQLTVVDFGVGIPNRVRSFPNNSGISTHEALKWAFMPGHTTKQDICSGMGLSLLHDFVAQNQGILTLFSNDGCVIVDDNGIKFQNTYTKFSGTLVNIGLRCDQSYYCLASEVTESAGLWF